MHVLISINFQFVPFTKQNKGADILLIGPEHPVEGVNIPEFTVSYTFKIQNV